MVLCREALLLLLGGGRVGRGFLDAHGLGGLDGVLVGAEDAVAPGEVLSVVVLEVSVVHVVVSRAVDDLPVGEGDAIVDGGGPDGDCDEENQVRELVHGDDEGAEPVGPRLRPRVERVERKGGEGTGEDEGVVQLVNGLVQQVAVQGVMDPVDAEVRDDEEEGDREQPVGNRLRDVVVKVKVQVDLGVSLL